MPKTIVLSPPSRVWESIDSTHPTIFLAGSIEMGTAEEWQANVIDKIPLDVTFLNPRRDNWDSSWEQSINNPHFYEQVSWELDMLNLADIIFMYFDPNTKAPISLLELGLHASTSASKMIVCCPAEFYRKGNVDIVCQRYGIPVFTSLDVAIIALKLLADRKQQ